MKKVIIVLFILAILISGGLVGYWYFYSGSQLEGGWQYKNILGVTNEVLLFDNGKCWLYDTGEKPYSVDYKTERTGNDSYKVNCTGNGNSVELLISFKDKDTINVGKEGSTDVYTMTRIDKVMAENMMGIS